jgi:hypothetical protein
MSITFNSGGNLGETDVSPNLKGIQKGKGNALFANFSDLLTSATGEDTDLTLETSSTKKQSASSLGEVDAKLFNKISTEGVLAEPVVNGSLGQSPDPVETMDVLGTPISCLVWPGFVGEPTVDGVEDLISVPVVDGPEELFSAPVVKEAKNLLATPEDDVADDLLAVPGVEVADDLLAVPVVKGTKNLLAEPVANVINQSDVLLDNLSSDPSIDDVINKLGISAALDSDVHLNTTSAFISSRIETLGPNVETGESEAGIKFSTFEDFVVALGVSEKKTAADGSKGELPAPNISKVLDLDFLSDLTDGISTRLELKDSSSSSIFFDIRDLKKNLNEAFSSNPSKNDFIKTPAEFLIPLTVPIELGVSSVTQKDYDPFIPVKFQLMDEEEQLGTTVLFDISGDDGLEPGVNLVSVTRAIEIGPDVDARSKLLIGLSIPKDTDLNKLPDFVKFDVSLQSGNRNGANAITPLLTEAQELLSAEITKEIEVPLDLKAKTKALILALGEMSNASKNGEKILTNIASTHPILKFSQKLDIQPVPLLEANSIFHKQILEANNSDLSNQDVAKVNNVGQKLLTLDLLQKQIIVEKNSVLLASTKIDGQVGPITSALNLVTPNKFYSSIKSDKNPFFSDQTGADAVEKKLDGNVFNPKSFFEAADTLKMKPITFLGPNPQGEQLTGRQPDITGFGINKFDNIASSNSSPSTVSEGLAASVNNKISLYSAQYASRLGMLVVDKVLKGQQNFEIHLEPESFGKIKVNVLLDKQSIDIRMVTETQAAASLLRANEDSLLQITAQNGMKLANFAVGMQSGSEQQRQNSNQNRNRVTDKANSVLKQDTARNIQSQTSYRTSTSLNLIA